MINEKKRKREKNILKMHSENFPRFLSSDNKDEEKFEQSQGK